MHSVRAPLDARDRERGLQQHVAMSTAPELVVCLAAGLLVEPDLPCRGFWPGRIQTHLTGQIICTRLIVLLFSPFPV